MFCTPHIFWSQHAFPKRKTDENQRNVKVTRASRYILSSIFNDTGKKDDDIKCWIITDRIISSLSSNSSWHNGYVEIGLVWSVRGKSSFSVLLGNAHELFKGGFSSYQCKEFSIFLIEYFLILGILPNKKFSRIFFMLFEATSNVRGVEIKETSRVCLMSSAFTYELEFFWTFRKSNNNTAAHLLQHKSNSHHVHHNFPNSNTRIFWKNS